MKGLVWNCKEVEWIYTDSEVFSKKSCLLVYVCCETGDNHKEIGEVTRRIMQLNRKRYGKSEVVIFPFAHLSQDIMEKKGALELLKKIQKKLKENINVSIMGFNKRKEIKIHLLPHNEDVSYFSY